MSERKVLNKYYPPEFDPSKIPRLKVKKTGVFSIRIMSPFNMRCNTCGEYIYKGKKFNSRKENVDDDDYLGLRIFRFYIRCPRCIAEIAFKTDLKNTDYTLEAGATRLFEAEKLAHQMAEKERKEKEEDELNPMKMLENRTKASRNEIEQLDQLEELREINARNAKLDRDVMLEEHMAYQEQLLKLEEQEEDKLVQAILRKGNQGSVIKRVKDDDDEEDVDKGSSFKKKLKSDASLFSGKASDILTDQPATKKEEQKESWQRSIGSFSNLKSKSSLAGLVKTKSTVKPSCPAREPSMSTATASNGTSSTINTTVELSKAPTSALDGLRKTASDSDCVPGGSQLLSKSGGPSSGLAMLGDYSDSEENSD